MKIKKSDFIRICPMSEMKPGEWGVSFETDYCLVQCLRETLTSSNGSKLNVVSISSTREWNKDVYTKSNLVGILGGTPYPNVIGSEGAKSEELHIQVEED